MSLLLTLAFPHQATCVHSFRGSNPSLALHVMVHCLTSVLRIDGIATSHLVALSTSINLFVNHKEPLP